MSRHAARDGMDRVADVDALRLEELGELTHVVLCLRDGEAVPGDDDDAARERELDGDVVGGGRPHGAAVVDARPAGARLHLAERAEQHVRDRAVHRLRHHQREEGARGADEHSGDDQHRRVEHEPRRGGREARERVQERDHDGHVGAADRQHEEDAEEEREPDQREQRPLGVDARDHRDAEPDGAEEDGGVGDVLRREHDRPSREELLELGERHERAGERDGADQRGEDDRDDLVTRHVAAPDVELRERDERGRTAADPVEQGHHLRHRGHLHRAGADHPDDRPDRGGDDEQGPVADPVEQRAS